MIEPFNSGIADRRRSWYIERALLVTSIVAMVLGAASSDSNAGVLTLVAASTSCLGLAGLAWYRDDVTTGEVILFALLARVIAFPLLPGLSDDGYRYIWDGWLQANGVNPFQYIPSDASLTEFHYDDLYENLNSPNYYSVYPPSSQIVFWIGGLLKGEGWIISWYSIKSFFVAIEIAGILAVAKFVAPRNLLLYAWNPLAIIEGAGQGHTEIAMVGALLLSLSAFRLKSYKSSLAALTSAVWFKLYPVVLLPFLLRRVGWRLTWVPVAVSIVMWIPFAEHYVLANMRSSLGLYVQLFEFNAGPYYALKWVGKLTTGSDLSKSIGPLLQLDFLFALIGLLVYDLPRRAFRLAAIWFAVLGLYLATATTVHPWYLLGVLALIPFILSTTSVIYHLTAFAWLWLSVGSLATYLLYSAGEWSYWASVCIGWLGWGLAFIATAMFAALPIVMQHRARSKWAWISSFLHPSSTLLDLGAGDGYVGAVAKQQTDVGEVILSDIVDFNQTELPFVQYDGSSLPFDDGEFDTTLLVYVLHHSADPDRVLNEARRVTSCQVAVLESIVETKADRRWLTFADTLANRIRSRGRMEEQPLNFCTVEAWRSRFNRAGFEIIAEQRRGYLFHKRHLFILR